MKIKKNNEDMMNNSNQTQNKKKMNEFQKQILIGLIDKLLIERLPDYINDEIKWIRKEYGDDDISDFLDGEEYYEHSVYLKKINEIIQLFEN